MGRDISLPPQAGHLFTPIPAHSLIRHTRVHAHTHPSPTLEINVLFREVRKGAPPALSGFLQRWSVHSIAKPLATLQHLLPCPRFPAQA